MPLFVIHQAITLKRARPRHDIVYVSGWRTKDAKRLSAFVSIYLSYETRLHANSGT